MAKRCDVVMYFQNTGKFNEPRQHVIRWREHSNHGGRHRYFQSNLTVKLFLFFRRTSLRRQIPTCYDTLFSEKCVANISVLTNISNTDKAVDTPSRFRYSAEASDSHWCNLGRRAVFLLEDARKSMSMCLQIGNTR